MKVRMHVFNVKTVIWPETRYAGPFWKVRDVTAFKAEYIAKYPNAIVEIKTTTFYSEIPPSQLEAFRKEFEVTDVSQ